MTNILIGSIIGLIAGTFLGGWIVKLFNVTDYKIEGKYKAKKGGIINLKNILKRKKDGKV
ncbi:minor spike protein [Rhodobacteraceae phage LS06-2018-MD05]|nr:minor spike protein [Rhodobacteraceae phage LS06-2018-MD05]